MTINPKIRAFTYLVEHASPRELAEMEKILLGVQTWRECRKEVGARHTTSQMGKNESGALGCSAKDSPSDNRSKSPFLKKDRSDLPVKQMKKEIFRDWEYI